MAIGPMVISRPEQASGKIGGENGGLIVGVRSVRGISPLRWLAPLWASLVLAWSTISYVFGDYDATSHHQPVPHDPAVIGLLALHVGLYVFVIMQRPARWQYAVCGCLQGALICGIGFVLQTWPIALILLLPLMAEALGVLRPGWTFALLLCWYLVCFALTLYLVGSWQLARGVLL